MYGTALTLAVLALLAYVLWRASSVCALRRLPRPLFPLAGLLLAAIVIAGRGLGYDGSGPWVAAMEFASWTVAGIVLLSSVCLLAVDLLTGFGLFFRGRAARLRGWALVAGCLLSALALVQGLRPPTVSRYEVFLPGLPAELDGTRIAAISDLHLGTLIGPRWLRARSEQLRSLRPDLVLFLGDTFEGHGGDPRASFPVLRRLGASPPCAGGMPLGTFAVDGNHELYGRRANRTAPPRDYPLRVLRDETVLLAPGLHLAGRRCVLSRGRETRKPWNPDTRGAAGAWILMSHAPSGAESAARAGVGLMLSGHTHGGQLWPLSLFTRRTFPLTAGRYRVGRMTVLVSRGAGTWGPRMRLWRPGEIMMICLRSEEPQRTMTQGKSEGSQRERQREGEVEKR
jgi:hypothetical protein